MIQRFYAYIDNNSFGDFFTTNSFVAQSLFPNIRGNRTLSLSTDNFIFITHKKINEQSRHFGINDSITSWPVVIQLDIDTDSFLSFPVILYKNTESGSILQEADIKDYSADTDVGCFIIGEIPFSLISGILFETYDQLADSDKSVFPDFLWSADLVKVLETDEFTEELSIALTDVDIKNVFPIDIEEEFEIIRIKMKYKAAILQAVNGTREWQINSYKTSFDSFLQSLFNLQTEDIKRILVENSMPVVDVFFSEKIENISLIPQKSVFEEKNIKQNLYNTIVGCFIRNAQSCDPDMVHTILGDIRDCIKEIITPDQIEGYYQLINSIEECYLNHSGFGVDAVCSYIDAIDGERSIFRALLFVIKNPSEFDKFILSLSLYKVDHITTRRALILWSYLNGLNGVPAIGYNRDNVELWLAIEMLVSKMFADKWQVLFKPSIDCKKQTNTSINGISITSEKIVTYMEVYDYLCADHVNVTKALIKEVYNVAKSVASKQFKNDPYIVYDVSEIGQEICDILSKNNYKLSKQDADNITKKVKEIKNNQELNYRKIYEDWILNESNFKKIWNLDEQSIKGYYTKRING